MACNEVLNTQALFDGELSAKAAILAERHVAGCVECSGLLKDLDSMRVAIAAGATRYPADSSQRLRIAAGLDRASPERRTTTQRGFWWGTLSGSLVSAAAAALAFFFLMAPETDEIVGDVTAAHIRSLIGTHLVDVATADPREANAWLAGHGATPLASFVPPGFQFAGARKDYVYEAPSTVLVYRRGTHIVNIFAWPEREHEELPLSASSRGYNIVFWKKGETVFCAISNLPVQELEKFRAA